MLININEVDVKKWIFHHAKRNQIHGVGSIRVNSSYQFKGTLLDLCLKLYTTLWNIWTYQQLCKKITQLVYNFTQIVYNFTQVV